MPLWQPSLFVTWHYSPRGLTIRQALAKLRTLSGIVRKLIIFHGKGVDIWKQCDCVRARAIKDVPFAGGRLCGVHSGHHTALSTHNAPRLASFHPETNWNVNLCWGRSGCLIKQLIMGYRMLTTYLVILISAGGLKLECRNEAHEGCTTISMRNVL